MTVGELKKLIKDLPDDAGICPRWTMGPPGDYDPGVSLDGFEVREQGHVKYLAALVSLFYFEDEDDDFEN